MSKVTFVRFYVVIFNPVYVRPIKLKGGYAKTITCDEIQIQAAVLQTEELLSNGGHLKGLVWIFLK